MYPLRGDGWYTIACMALAISHTEVGPEGVVVSLEGKLMLGPAGEEIPALVEEFLRQGKKTIIFDLSGLSHIDSTGIGRFIASYNKIAAVGGEMRMAAATGHLFQSFHVSLLDQVFPFFATVEEAKAAA
jgi:anti-sigma B factor antagonist